MLDSCYALFSADFIQSETCTPNDNRGGYDCVYPGHIPTSGFQKFLLAVGSSLITISNPLRGGTCILLKLLALQS